MSGIGVPNLLNAIGPEATQMLVHAKGGQEFWIPQKLRDDHWLVGVIGKEAALGLCEGFGGEQVILPLGYEYQRRQAKSTAKQMRADGAKINEIVKATGVSINTLQKWFAEKVDPNQTCF